MSAFSKAIRLITALVSLGAALVLLRNTGLPDRSDYGGYRLQDTSYAAAEVGAVAPRLALLTPDLRAYTLQPIDAPVIIVNFWATWCRPCREELRALQELQDAEPRLIRVVAINLGERPATVSEWIQDQDLSIDVLVDPSQSAAASFRVRGLPATYLLDGELRIHRIFFGAFSRHQLLRAVNQITNA